MKESNPEKKSRRVKINYQLRTTPAPNPDHTGAFITFLNNNLKEKKGHSPTLQVPSPSKANIQRPDKVKLIKIYYESRSRQV